jgi:hypothetical protein
VPGDLRAGGVRAIDPGGCAEDMQDLMTREPFEVGDEIRVIDHPIAILV